MGKKEPLSRFCYSVRGIKSSFAEVSTITKLQSDLGKSEGIITLILPLLKEFFSKDEKTKDFIEGIRSKFSPLSQVFDGLPVLSQLLKKYSYENTAADMISGKKIIKELKPFLEKKKSVNSLKPTNYPEFRLLMLTANEHLAKSNYHEIFCNSVLVSLISIFENLFLEFIRSEVERNFSLLKDLAKELGIIYNQDEIKKNEYFDEKLDECIDKLIYKKEKWLWCINDFINIEFNYLKKINQLRERTIRRNLFIHNSSLIDKKYLDLHHKLDDKYTGKIGDKLSISSEYINSSIDLIYLFALEMGISIYIKNKEVHEIINIVDEEIEIQLAKENWDVLKELLEFIISQKGLSLIQKNPYRRILNDVQNKKLPKYFKKLDIQQAKKSLDNI
jgi:hypothetical protein